MATDSGQHDRDDLLPRDRFVLTAIELADEPIGRETIKRKTGYSDTTVSRALTTLQDLGFIESETGIDGDLREVVFKSNTTQNLTLFEH